MTLASALLTVSLYVSQFSAQFNTTTEQCPIEISKKKCVREAHGCDWHGYVDYEYHPKTRQVINKRIILNLNHLR